MSPKIAIVIHTMYGHTAIMAEAVKAGVEAASGKADLFQIQETLSDEFLKSRNAAPKPDFPIMSPGDLVNYDGFLFGISARYGTLSAQWKTFLDATGFLWGTGALYGKYAGAFVSTGFLGGGQETTILQTVGTLAHHGIIFVPFGYKNAMHIHTRVDEAHGGSPWGAGCLAGADGSRKPSALELDMAKLQGEHFYRTLARVNFD